MPRVIPRPASSAKQVGTMTGDPNKAVPLPSGPASLCFDKDVFMKDGFDVDSFVMECRRRVPLETLRDDLNTYLKILRSAMIELINKDYADFVNLSTNLVGMDKAITNLTVPLGEMKDQVMTVKVAMEEAVHAVEEKLKQREQIREKKACLQRLMNIISSVEKIEKLLGISDNESTTGTLTGQLIERVANEFNKLQFNVTKSKGHALVDKIRPRITTITTTLQYSLEGHFVEGLENGNVEILQQCLRTYALIDKIKDAENLFRINVVRPYMEKVITEQFLKSNNLQGMYAKILEFVPLHCKILRDVTTGSSDTVRGYDFLVNAVWPEVVSDIEAGTSSIFAPGNPAAFHQKYNTSMDFLCKFEKLCGSKASVKRLREHPSYHTFMNKWSLPVYFQIRFQDIAGQLETALCTGLNTVAGNKHFHLHSTVTLEECVRRCWEEDIYLQPLCQKFWRLTLQMFSRYATWIHDLYQDEVVNKKSPEVKPNPVNEDNPPEGQQQNDGPTVPVQPPITNGQILCLISDVESLSQQVSIIFADILKPRLCALGVDNVDSLLDNIRESSDQIKSELPQFQSYIVQDVCSQCAVHLKQVNDIPRLYRRTNREVPSKPSQYIQNVCKPLTNLLEDSGSVLSESVKNGLLQDIFSSLAEQYYSSTSDVLTSVKKMEESLKRLKKGRGTDKSSGSQGFTDDDKIRQQVMIDIENYGQQITNYGVDPAVLEHYQKLLQLSSEAKSAMTTSN
ncbi:conserved oligomeric Golgi complex subunit 2-like [Mytilus galloprovincialis]|uniref:conserved oligomeric Golgi complex subunit 2-like n=1 Tax=Mytilus galloprovincialis TaxID=29158 RepID=UPI003F7C636A